MYIELIVLYERTIGMGNDMEELINNVGYSQKIENIENYNQNELFMNIVKAQRWDLLLVNDIKLNILEDEISLSLIDYLLKDEDALWYLDREGYSFTHEVKEQIKQIVLKRYFNDNNKFDNFLAMFFKTKEEKEEYVTQNRQKFIEHLSKNPSDIAYKLLDIDAFVGILLSERKTQYLRKVENFTPENFKLLASAIKDGVKLPEYYGNKFAIDNIFSNIDTFTPEELYSLLTLFVQKGQYVRNGNDGELDSFSTTINNNIDKVISAVVQSSIVPKCLVENSAFRDECIKRNYMNLAVQCILPTEIINDEQLAELYSNELKIEKKDLFERLKWLAKYSEKNKDVFETFVAHMLKDNIFKIPDQHLERIINDVEPQMAFSNLNDKELEVLNLIFNKFKFKDYDVSFMLNTALKNIHNFSDLIQNLEITELDDRTLGILVSVLQHSQNKNQIKTINDLNDYVNIKQQNYKNSRANNNLEESKDSICQYMFNLSLEQAKAINKKYCYTIGYNGKFILDKLKSSELPQELFYILNTIHNIIETDDITILDNYFLNCPAQSVYSSPIPLETFLRSQYSVIMSNSLYKPNAPVKEENGMPDKLLRTTDYNGQKIDICIPRASFRFLVHGLGTCSNEKSDNNYQKDWEGRPQIQDHFVACSYIDEKSIFSTRSGSEIVFGFGNLEGGALAVMGPFDIDSIGTYSRKYSASEDFMKQGGNCNFLVPSMLLESTTNGYNEVVIERRNQTDKSNTFKRTPDYIIMSVDSLENGYNFMLVDELLNNELPGLSNEEKNIIKQSTNAIEIKEIIKRQVMNFDIPLEEKKVVFNKLIINLLKSKNYERNLKASGEFNVPLIVIDQTYYLKKLLNESQIYDEQQKIDILNLFTTTEDRRKKDVFQAVARNVDYDKIMPNIQNRSSVRNF